ncbi:MAG: hypothetical protein HY744_22505 [Deltaproteobacteria bacterium]|nr:hypothetical protein [Deltaproteobacteria bacterium]
MAPVVAAALWWCPGCAAEPAETPAPAGPCTMHLDPVSGADLSLTGSGLCPASVTLRLRVATGSPEAPVWAGAEQGPVRVEGDWELGPHGAVRHVTVRNAGAEPVRVLGLEWSSEGQPLGFAPDRVLHNGYQSWSYTGIEAIPHLWQKVSADGARTYLAVFAWSAPDYRVDLALPASAHELVLPAEPGAGVAERPGGGAISVAVPAQGVRLFAW